MLVTRHEVFCFLDSRYIEAGRAKIHGATVGLTSREMPLKAWLETAVSDCAIKKLGFEEDYMSFLDHSRFCKMLPECEFLPAGEILTNLRASKDSSELQNIKKAQEITERVFADLLELIKPDMTEREIAAEITYRHLLYGASGNSFDPIVVSGKKSSMPHGVPDDSVICRGDFLTMDFGCVYGGYCSDMTRTIAIDHATDEMVHVYNTVLEAQLAGIAAACAGVSGVAIDKAGRDVIDAAGYGKFFDHSFGHSLGLDIHEMPSASPSCETIMPSGAVISAEPGIYIPEKFGVRIEDIIHLTENGAENLTSAPKYLIIL